jgi:hypothetical protein
MAWPIVLVGSSAPYGSWKMTWSLLRISLSSLPRALLTSLPSTSTVPWSGLSSRAISRPTVVLPEPDSPTMPTVVPARTSRSTPSTAWTLSSVRPSKLRRSGKDLVRPRTRKTT